MKKGLLVLVLLLVSASLFAMDGYLIVYNRTGFEIQELYVSHATDDGWEEDVLGGYVLPTDESFTVTLEGYKTLVFDVMAVDEDGDTYYFWEINAEYNDLSITLDYLSVE